MGKYAKFRPNQTRLAGRAGYSLIEIIVVVIILGILATVSIRALLTSNEASRTARTRVALDLLAHAIVGNPDLVSGGARADFGYIGDIGALPPNLSALLTNPGGYTTWRGPYLSDHFTLSGTATALFKDAWGQVYTYSGTPLIQSTGSGSSISRSLAGSVDDLLYNRLDLTILDLDQHPPGPVLMDSILISLTVPDGTGSTINRLVNPSRDGSASIDSLPIGQHHLLVIYLPNADSLNRRVIIEPGRSTHLQMTFPADLW